MSEPLDDALYYGLWTLLLAIGVFALTAAPANHWLLSHQVVLSDRGVSLVAGLSSIGLAGFVAGCIRRRRSRLPRCPACGCTVRKPAMMRYCARCGARLTGVI